MATFYKKSLSRNGPVFQSTEQTECFDSDKTDAPGFMLVAVLISLCMIGLLAAIAIPQFSKYRERAYDSAAVADLKNAATAQEAYFVETETYCTDVDVLVGPVDKPLQAAVAVKRVPSFTVQVGC